MTKFEILQMAIQHKLWEGTDDDIYRFAEAVMKRRNEELADKIAALPFGDTSASFAQWIRDQS